MPISSPATAPWRLLLDAQWLAHPNLRSTLKLLRLLTYTTSTSEPDIGVYRYWLP
jgi:hypothetical protein